MDPGGSVNPEYHVFLSENFDARQYTNCILSGISYPPSKDAKQQQPSAAEGAGAKTSLPPPQDVTRLYSKLTSGLDDINKQLRTEIVDNHSALLENASSLTTLSKDISKVEGGLNEVSQGVKKVHKRIRAPCESLESGLTRQNKLQEALEYARRTARYATLVRRLGQQAQDFDGSNNDESSSDYADQALAYAALTLAEIDTLLRSSTYGSDGEVLFSSYIKSIPAFQTHTATVEHVREKIEETMEDMVREGLGESNQAVLASALQIAYNLGYLPSLVASLVTDLTDQIETRIRIAFDIADFSKEMSSKDLSPAGGSPFSYKSRARTEPTTHTLPQWTTALWARLENLLTDIGGCCIKVYTLERALRLKKDSLRQNTFLASVTQILDNKPSNIFWATFARSFEGESRKAAAGSQFIRQTLSVGYPRLLRLINDFFSRMAVFMDNSPHAAGGTSPETVLILRSISYFEGLYHRSSDKRGY